MVRPLTCALDLKLDSCQAGTIPFPPTEMGITTDSGDQIVEDQDATAVITED